MAIAYLRVSTKRQGVENQKNEIMKFANRNGLDITQWFEEVASGKQSCNSRKLGTIINKMKKDDSLIVSELSRLSRNVFESVEILNTCLKKSVNLHCVKENYSCTNDMASIILGIISSIFSQMERTLISQRTKEALAEKKKDGAVLGRPKGSSRIWSRLLDEKEKIRKLLKEKITKKKIAKIFGISRVTLYKFIAIL